MERLLFPYISYDNKPSSFGKRIKTAFIYTMNVPENQLDNTGYKNMFNKNRTIFERLLGESEILISTETFQFDDYDQYAASQFDIKDRKIRHETVFKEDCKKAFALGERLTIG